MNCFKTFPVDQKIVKTFLFGGRKFQEFSNISEKIFEPYKMIKNGSFRIVIVIFLRSQCIANIAFLGQSRVLQGSISLLSVVV